MTSLAELNYSEICELLNVGHIGDKTKDLFELRGFYTLVRDKKEELENEMGKNFPVNRYFYAESENVKVIFKVLEVVFNTLNNENDLLITTGYNLVDGNSFEGYFSFSNHILCYNTVNNVVLLLNSSNNTSTVATEITEEEYNTYISHSLSFNMRSSI